MSKIENSVTQQEILDEWEVLSEWGDEGVSEYVVGWLIIVGTEQDAGRVIIKTMFCSTEGKLRQQEQEISDDITMPNYVRSGTRQALDQVLSILSIAQVNDPVLGVGKKIADDVYWIEGGYEKTINNG